MPDYSDDAKKVYGNACEFDGCGWQEASCDVHHINYDEQQGIEVLIRQALKKKDNVKAEQLIKQAKDKGFLSFDKKTMELDKDNRTTNLAVLCPNHHRYTHFKDLKMSILNHLPPRK